MRCRATTDDWPGTRAVGLPPKDGKLAGTLRVGEMADGATCEIVAAIRDKDGKAISAKKETFTRKVMPFETAPKAGIADLVPAPFTPPLIAGSAVSCVGPSLHARHGRPPESLVAAGEELLAAPAALKVEDRRRARRRLRRRLRPTLTARGDGAGRLSAGIHRRAG